MSDRMAWKMARRGPPGEWRIGASEVAAVFEQHPHCSALQLWQRLRSPVEEDEMDDAQNMGHETEALNLRLYEEKEGHDAVRKTHPDYGFDEKDMGSMVCVYDNGEYEQVWQSKAHPWRSASYDAFADPEIDDPEYCTSWIALELKNLDRDQIKHWRKDGHDTIPPHIVHQLASQIADTNMRGAAVSVIFGGQKHRTYFISREELQPTIDMQNACVGDWVQAHLVEGLQPDIVPGEKAAKLLKAIYPEHNPGKVVKWNGAVEIGGAVVDPASIADNWQVALDDIRIGNKAKKRYEAVLRHVAGDGKFVQTPNARFEIGDRIKRVK